MTGKVTKGIAGFYYTNGERNHVYQYETKGMFRNRKIRPFMEDNVELSVLDEEEKEDSIDVILPRPNILIRPAVANVDQALVMFAITHPEPDLNLLGCFLVMTGIQGVLIAVCSDKAGLGETEPVDRYRIIYERTGYGAHFASTCEDTGLEEMKKFLRGKTSALVGPSGVGKPSLTDCIQPQTTIETGDISRKIERECHITRHSELFYVGRSTYMMDVPGFSSIFISRLEPGELKDYFPELGSYEGECRFLGCVRMEERVCGVKEALKRGELSRSCYGDYIPTYEDLKSKRRY